MNRSHSISPTHSIEDGLDVRLLNQDAAPANTPRGCCQLIRLCLVGCGSSSARCLQGIVTGVFNYGLRYPSQAVVRGVQSFDRRQGYLFGLMDNNPVRRYPQLLASLGGQTGTLFGSVFFTLWWVKCRGEVHECDIETNKAFFYDCLVSAAYFFISSAVMVWRYKKKAKPMFVLASAFHDLPNDAGPNEMFPLLREFQQLQSHTCLTAVTRLHKVMRALLAAYLVAFASVGSTLLTACISKDSICSVEEVFDHKRVILVGTLSILGGLGAFQIWEDPISTWNDAAECKIQEVLEQRELLPENSAARRPSCHTGIRGLIAELSRRSEVEASARAPDTDDELLLSV